LSPAPYVPYAGHDCPPIGAGHLPGRAIMRKNMVIAALLLRPAPSQPDHRRRPGSRRYQQSGERPL